MNQKLPLALTMGDPCGIALEITAKAWTALRETGPVFFLIHDPKVVADWGVPLSEITHPSQATACFGSTLPVLRENLVQTPTLGQPHSIHAAATINSITRAVSLAQNHEVCGIVTNPIHKKSLHQGGSFPFQGHTEFLASLAGVETVAMMLATPGLRVVPLTIHIPLALVPVALSQNLIVKTARVVFTALKRDFDLEKPRLCIAGLNPHAGEGGCMGTEEITLIKPALDYLAAEGIGITGPLPADTLFHADTRALYDRVLCCYHDQALIPLKMLDFHQGVNVTLGLPFIRTSPDHGVAHDIAGGNKANPSSLIAAITMADILAQKRS